MTTQRLPQDFYRATAVELAPLLLGKFLCRRIEDEVTRLRITETEAYFGEGDTACHAHKGKTPRTKTLYAAGGVAYVYLCYGIHHLLNVVTGAPEHPEAVLIRGVEGAQGPGRLTKLLHVDRTLNGINLSSSDLLWLEDDGTLAPYTAHKRIGIGYASAEDQERLWRFQAVSIY